MSRDPALGAEEENHEVIFEKLGPGKQGVKQEEPVEPQWRERDRSCTVSGASLRVEGACVWLEGRCWQAGGGGAILLCTAGTAGSLFFRSCPAGIYTSKAHLLFLRPAGHVIPHVSLVVSVYITQAPCLVSYFPTAPDSVAGPSATSVSDCTLTS